MMASLSTSPESRSKFEHFEILGPNVQLIMSQSTGGQLFRTPVVRGVHNFLRKLWRLMHDKDGNVSVDEGAPSKDALKSEGPALKSGDRVFIVDDVATSGGSLIQSAQVVAEETGATVVGALVIVDRQEGAAEKLAEAGIAMESLFKKADFV